MNQITHTQSLYYPYSICYYLDPILIRRDSVLDIAPGHHGMQVLIKVTAEYVPIESESCISSDELNIAQLVKVTIGIKSRK